MSQVKVVFFAADPLSADGGHQRLRLDEDVRQIRYSVRTARYRDELDFDAHWATRTQDLLLALNETHPQVVHFSGHGATGGLVLVSADGHQSHVVDTAALARLFEVFRGDIRVVVLSACFSLPQAEAIAAAVGCAIGTRGEISDEAAITFGASFYRAIAFGHSVQTAFDQARAALALDHVDDRECPELVARPDVDPSKLILIEPGDVGASGRRPASTAPGQLDPPRISPAAPPPGLPTRNRARNRRRASTAVAALLLIAAGGYGASELLSRRGPDKAEPQSSVVRQDSIANPTFPAPPPTDSAPPASQVTTAPPAALDPRDTATTVAHTAERPVPRTLSVPDSAVAPAGIAAARELYAEQKFAAALPLFERAARDGDVEAMAYLGIMHLSGEGTARRPDLAIPWLRQAAEAGNPRGMNALGYAYQQGTGVPRDYGEALRLYQRAQEKGFPHAMNNIGTLYRQGWGVQRSYETALDWYRKAANAGLADGMTHVGAMYDDALGVERDVAEARRWYQSAAAAGSRQAMFNLGKLHQQERDYGPARTWYIQAAEKGSPAAMNNLGVLFINGWGVNKDRTEAIRWFRLAAAAGSADAVGNLAALGVR